MNTRPMSGWKGIPVVYVPDRSHVPGSALQLDEFLFYCPDNSRNQSADKNPGRLLHLFDRPDMRIDWLVNDLIFHKPPPDSNYSAYPVSLPGFDHDLINAIAESCPGPEPIRQNLLHRYDYMTQEQPPGYISDFTRCRSRQKNVIETHRELYHFVCANIVGNVFLDTGASNYVLGAMAASRFPDIRVIVSDLDTNPWAIQWLQEHIGRTMEPITADLLNPHSIPPCDTAAMLFVLEHLSPDESREALLNLVKKAARRVIVAVPVEPMPDMVPGHLQLFNRNKLEAILPDCVKSVHFPLFRSYMVVAVLDTSENPPLDISPVRQLHEYEQILKLIDEGQEEKALKLLNRRLQKNPDDCPALASSAELYYNRGDYDNTLRTLEKLEAMEPRNRHIPLFRGLVLMNRKQYREAARHLKKACVLSNAFLYPVDNRNAANAALAYSYARAGNMEDAITIIRGMNNVDGISDPLAREALISLGHLYMEQANYTEAAEYFSLLRDSLRAMKGYADALWLSGKKEEAINGITTLLNQYPGDPDIAMKAGIWRLETDSPDEAGMLLHKALKLGRRDALRRLGDLHIRTGNVFQAAHYYGSAIRERPEDAESWLGLAGAARQLGQRRAAAQCLKKAVLLARDGKDIVMSAHLTELCRELAILGKTDEALKMAEKFRGFLMENEYHRLMVFVYTVGADWSQAAREWQNCDAPETKSEQRQRAWAMQASGHKLLAAWCYLKARNFKSALAALLKPAHCTTTHIRSSPYHHSRTHRTLQGQP